MQSKEMVEGYWDGVFLDSGIRLLSGLGGGDIVCSKHQIGTMAFGETDDAAWDVAHAYTLEHQEEVRQLKSQVQFAAEDIWNEASWKDFFDFMDFLDDDSLLEQISIAVRRQCAYVRTLAMLESALADKLRGTRGPNRKENESDTEAA